MEVRQPRCRRADADRSTQRSNLSAPGAMQLLPLVSSPLQGHWTTMLLSRRACAGTRILWTSTSEKSHSMIRLWLTSAGACKYSRLANGANRRATAIQLARSPVTFSPPCSLGAQVRKSRLKLSIWLVVSLVNPTSCPEVNFFHGSLEQRGFRNAEKPSPLARNSKPPPTGRIPAGRSRTPPRWGPRNHG